MDIAQFASLLAACAALGGVAWTIWGGRKKLNGDTRATAFEQAMELLDAKTAEIDRLTVRVGELERRDRWHERRERRLIEALGRYIRVPNEIIEADIGNLGDDDEDTPPPQSGKPPRNPPRKPPQNPGNDDDFVKRW